jgi:hypothetical protein
MSLAGDHASKARVVLTLSDDLQPGAESQASETTNAKGDGKQTVKQVSLHLNNAMLSTSSCLQGFQQLPDEEDARQQLQVDEQGGAEQP